MTLEEIYQESKNSERYFKYKNVLFIGSESYDTPTITVIEGLQELGFNIFTIKKANINSWFCNKVIENLDNVKFDFVLSGLHWGTRWSYYQKYNLSSYLKVLIDGDDNMKWRTWQEKFEYYKKAYAFNPPEEVKDREIAFFHWVESLGDYKPDIVFTSQKQFNDNISFYLPFGIHREYFSLFENKSAGARKIDFCHIEGPGIKRKKMKYLIKLLTFFKVLPGKVFNGHICGEIKIPEQIIRFLKEDSENNRPHGYHRWTMGKDYFKTLNDSKVLIYPGIDSWPFWDSKRPWEAYASGCLVLMSKPSINVSEYPVTEICNFAVFNSYSEFIRKCRYLFKNQLFLDRLRQETYKKTLRYFSPKPLADYFLKKIKEKC